VLKLADPKRGDIIIFDSKVSNIRLVKRVVAVPGDIIQMSDNRLIINGHVLDYQLITSSNDIEDRVENLLGIKHPIRIHKTRSSSYSFTAMRIPEGFYMALGDNRDNSADSRFIGLIPRNEIVGRTQSVVMSLNYDNYYLPRGDRFLKKF
jgi:signal peptidase I